MAVVSGYAVIGAAQLGRVPDLAAVGIIVGVAGWASLHLQTRANLKESGTERYPGDIYVMFLFAVMGRDVRSSLRDLGWSRRQVVIGAVVWIALLGGTLFAAA